MSPVVAPPPHPVRVLWAVPRSASTAFERMVIERGDHTVLDEPYSAAHYHGPERISPRYQLSEPGATVPAITAHIEGLAEDGPVFVKDMAYHPGPHLDAVVDRPWSHTFLVRDPRWSVPSMARIWPDLTEEEAGFAAVERAVARLAAAGRDVLVLDSDELCRDPAGVVERWCGAVGVAPDRDALTWEAGMRPEWERWQDWYGATSRSEGFLPPRDGDPPEVTDPRLAAIVARSLETYAGLLSVAPRR